MQSVKNYLAGEGRDRMLREAFLFHFINYVDSNFVPDDEQQNPKYEKISMTFQEKCRIRNNIFRVATRYVEDWNASHDDKISVNDPAVLVKCFFEGTNYGQKYQNSVNEWNKVHSDVVKLIDGWRSQNAVTYNACLVSPYDPRFENRDAFDEKHDFMGYAFFNKVDDNTGLSTIRYGLNTKQVEPVTDMVTISRRSPVVLEGLNVQSGYADIARYISSAKERTAIASYLAAVDKSGDDKRMSLDNKRFMRAACRYLSEHGIGFDVMMKNDSELIIKCDNSVEIRLWDTENPGLYQGRIYDGGQKIYLGMSRSVYHEDYAIRAKHRMDLLKWYFGTEQVPILERNIDGTDVTRDNKINVELAVGQMAYLTNIPFLKKSGDEPRGLITTTRSNRKTGQTASSIMLSYIHTPNGDNPINIMFDGVRNERYASHETVFTSVVNPVRSINIPVEGNDVLVADSDAYADTDADAGDGQNNANNKQSFRKKWNIFRTNIDPSFILEGDAETYVREDGTEGIRIKEVIPQDHVFYYEKITTRNTLAEWVQSAKDTHRSYMRLDELMQDYELYESDRGYVPVSSSDGNVDRLRDTYFKFLVGSSDDFDITEYVSEDKLPGFVKDVSDLSLLSVDEKIQLINLHYDAYLESEFGNVPMIGIEPGPVETGFNPDLVARYVNNKYSHSVTRNQDYITYMLMNLGDYYSPDWIPYDNYVSGMMRNNLIKYDPSNEVASFTFEGLQNMFQDKQDYTKHLFDSRGNLTDDAFSILSRWNDISGLKDKPVSFDMMTHIARTLVESGCAMDSVKVSIDGHGIVHYEGMQSIKKEATKDQFKDSMRIVKGDIGQIFEPDQYGGIYPNTVTPQSDVFIPGYTAYLVPDDPNNPVDVRDRLRLVGWQSQLKQTITRTIHSACFRDVTDYNFYPHAAGLNRVYRNMYDMTFNKQFYDMHLPAPGQEPTDEQVTFLNVVKTMTGRCKFSSEYEENATTMAQSYLENPEQEASRKFDWYYSNLCNNENLRVMSPSFDGIFDPNLTGTAKNQGAVRYLADGIVVDNITNKPIYTKCPSGVEPPETALMKDDIMKRKYHDTWDRRIMAASQVATAWHTPRNIGAAMLTLDGWGFDDGPIVSKRFAETYKVPVLGEKGLKSMNNQMRPLMVQDKLSDMGGNKGVIGMVADPMLSSHAIEDRFFDAMIDSVSLDDPDVDPSLLSMKSLIDILHETPWMDDQGNKVSISKLSHGSCFIGNREFNIDFDNSKDAPSHYVQFAKHIQDTLYLDIFDMTPDTVTDGVHITYEGEEYDIILDPDSRSSYLEQTIRQIQCAKGLKGKDHVLNLFYDNPDLDVVVSPYSGMSRGNASTVLSLMEGGVEDLYLDDGRVLKGAMGHTNFIVVDMLADVKTHVYGDDTTEDSHGRKASAQLAWALAAKGSVAIMNEFYGQNGSALDDMREYAICIGMDFDENMQPLIGYHPQTDRGEKRRLMKFPNCSDVVLSYRDKSSEYMLAKNTTEGKTDADISAEILEQLNKSGGFMELPFPLKYNIDDFVKGVPMFSSYVKNHPMQLAKTGQTVNIGGKNIETYGMPVLSSMLRSGQEFVDGTLKLHDYTMQYVSIYKNAIVWSIMKKAHDDLQQFNRSLRGVDNVETMKKLFSQYIAAIPNSDKELKPVYKAMLKDLETFYKKEVKENKKPLSDFVKGHLNNFERSCKTAEEKAQSSFDFIVGHIVDNRFDTKHNIIRKKVMSKRINKSASMVWSADPRCKSDEVMMSEEQAKKLFGKHFDPSKSYSVLLWRDPVLRDGGVRYMKVVINNDLLGCAINPLMDISFDGDFDGDSVGVVPLTTSEARKEAAEKFSFEANMLDYGKKILITNPETGEERHGYPLFIQSGQDRAANEVARDEDGNILFKNGVPVKSDLRVKIEKLEWDINVFEEKVDKWNKGELSDSDITIDARDKEGNVGTYSGKTAITIIRRQYKKEIDRWMKDVLKGIGTDYINLTDTKTVLHSFQNIVDDKGKGSNSKMDFYFKNFGVEYERDENDRIKEDTIKEYRDKDGHMVNAIEATEGYSALRAFDNRVQETVAYKADNTQLGGMFSQKGVMAFRDTALKELLELTYPVTQSILQSKHDPIDAKVKDKIARFWGMDCWNGYRLTGDWSEDLSAEEIVKQPHHRVLLTAQTPDGKKIPVRKYNQETKKYEDVYDDEGHIVYEQVYARCSRDEWIKQMKGMFKAMNVDINPDYIDRLADLMLEDTKFPVKSINGNVVTYQKDGEREKTPIKWAKPKVCGLEEFAERHGALIDRMGYVGKFNALVEAACVMDDGYQKYVREKGSGYVVDDVDTNLAYTSLMGNASAVATDIGDAHEDDLIAGRKHRALEMDARKKLSNSALFTPDVFINEICGDSQRMTTGLNTNSVILVGKDGKAREDEESNEILRIEKRPRPIGRSDCQLTEFLFNAGDTYMFESDKQYKDRMASINAVQANINMDEVDGIMDRNAAIDELSSLKGVS